MLQVTNGTLNRYTRSQLILSSMRTTVWPGR